MKAFVSAVLFLAVLSAMSCSNNVTSSSSSSSSGAADPYAVVNASFESGMAGWAISDSSGLLGTNGIIFLTNEAVDGSQALAIQQTNYGTAGVVQFVQYQTNKTYVLNVSIKDSLPNYKNILLELCDSSSNVLSARYFSLIHIQSWSGWINTNLVLAGTNLSGFIKVMFYVERNTAGTPELIVDNVVLSNY